MPVKWDLGLHLKITRNWDCFPKISWDFGLARFREYPAGIAKI